MKKAINSASPSTINHPPSMQLTIVHLYPKEMNIYGDTGNRLVLQLSLIHISEPTRPY